MKRADGRPRIHLWPFRGGTYWSIGPTGSKRSCLSAGDALEAALDHVDHKPAVIIYEGAT